MSASRAPEVSGNYLSNPGAEAMKNYMAVDDFIFCDKSLVGRFTQMNPTLQGLQQWSATFWRCILRSNWMFKILGGGFFKIEFFDEDDCQIVLNNGPWYIQGVAELSLNKWSPDFDPHNPGPLETPIWFKNISRTLSNYTNLSINMLGSPHKFPGNDLSNSGANYMSVDDFIFHDKSLVGRFVDMNPAFTMVWTPTVQEISGWSGAQWGRNMRSKWIFKMLGEGYFRIEFFCEDDCEFVLSKGTWIWFWYSAMARLSLERWSPDFDPRNPGPFV